MPRGFLVKRSKRASAASYRVRDDEKDPLNREYLPDMAEMQTVAHTEEVRLSRHALFERCLSSPASAESFPTPTSVTPIERLLMHPLTFSGSDIKMDTPAHLYSTFHHAMKRPYGECTERKNKGLVKKTKVMRKLNFEDEVTTSPVLGLKIKKECPGLKPSASSGSRNPLGEFICQLCKEEYPDPFSLAQHKCSRIVRVEYRCPECEKVFSCPANLASHRRWHKPRPWKRSSRWSKAKRTPANEVALPHSPTPGLQDELFECHHCQKKFRRQAYLRKHLAAHEVVRSSSSSTSSSSYCHIESGQITYPCHLCGLHFPSAEIRDKHRLWHAQMYSCKHCPSTFFSSPALTRHINKCHPTESRQVLLLQVPVGPGC
uniref:INSM transcriptional repressor 2 n=1 Tax=Erpetoichthys calabaricus TaxID=27687 RepID=A0A8C4SR58_ERPCA